MAAVLVLSSGGEEATDTARGAAPVEIMDVHGLAVDPADGALYLAMHSGLARAAADATVFTSAGGPEQDLMGFSIAGPKRFVASGHPGPGQDLPNPIGLIRSSDRGRTWKQVSLTGEADFHLLEASGSMVYGVYDRFVVSADGGASWKERELPGEVVDLAVDPRRPRRVAASTADGVAVSEDAGARWGRPVERPQSLLAWARDGALYAVSADGEVSVSRDRARSWKALGRATGQPAAFTTDTDGAVYIAHADGSVEWSIDGGLTWQPRIGS